MSKCPLLNFQWHIPDQLATGGKPDTDEKLDWLISQGFRCIVSLEAIPDSIRSKLMSQRISCSMTFCDEDEPMDPESQKHLFEFIAEHILNGYPVYVHCSASIKRSPQFINEYLSQAQKALMDYLAKRANDLNHGDDFDWVRGHIAFDGDQINRAIAALEKALNSNNAEIRLTAADTLVELIEHADHNCFNTQAIVNLKRLKPKVLRIVFQLNPKFQGKYREIFTRFNYFLRHLI